jgi:hypothetical protein
MIPLHMYLVLTICTNVFTLILSLSEGRAGNAWIPFNKMFVPKYKAPLAFPKNVLFTSTLLLSFLTCSLFVFNPLKTKLVYVLFKIAVRTSKRTPHFTITKINLLTLFKEVIAVCSENDTKPKKTKCSVTD